MKKLVGVVILLAGMVSMVFAKNPVRFSVAYENIPLIPYYYGEGDLIPEKPGVAVDMIKLMASRRKDIHITIMRLPWKRCLSLLQEGEIDATFIASFKQERLEFGKYPMLGEKDDPRFRMATLSYSMYKNKISDLTWDGKEFKNLDQKIIGAILGYSIVDDLKKMGVVVDESKSTVYNLRKLALNRVVGVAALADTADAYLKEEEFKDIVKMEPPLITKNYYMMMSKQFVAANAKIAKEIWQDVSDIREKEINELFKPYLD